MLLPSSKMTVDEANGRILDHESRYNRTLVSVQTVHAPLDGGDSNVFQGRDKFLADEDASEEPDEVFCVLDYVPLSWKRTLDLQNEPVMP